jgi:hypothetical protein
VSLALPQEPDRLHVPESDFNEVKNNVLTMDLVNGSAELRQLLGANSAAHVRMAAPASRERMILSIEIDRSGEHTIANPRAIRNSLYCVDEPTDSHERRESLARC